LTAKQHKDGFWEDMEEAQKVSKQLKLQENKFARFNKLVSAVEDALVLIELSEEGEDDSEFQNIVNDVKSLTEKVEALRLETLLRGKYDSLNAILTLHAGAGGTEAQDWVSMLYRMYTRYLERMGYGVKLLDMLDGDEAGIKSVTFLAEGDNAYGF
jgi:peptide chain release factor 2